MHDETIAIHGGYQADSTRSVAPRPVNFRTRCSVVRKQAFGEKS
jgi:hypothetical protein